jgi:MFS family permease
VDGDGRAGGARAPAHASGCVAGIGHRAARYAPVLLLTPYAGVIVDRRNKRRILLLTQSSLAGVSLVLGLLVLSGAVRLWMVFAVALAFGMATKLDNPARLAFVSEMVGRRLIHNAVTLNSTFVKVRGVGPMVAAALVATVGVGWCFVAQRGELHSNRSNRLSSNTKKISRTKN